uniref:Uncharacterized protein n=1 Tax=Anguilla anguilla TaxID=7936 RepID=A0A0E9RLY6_ANGAN
MDHSRYPTNCSGVKILLRCANICLISL